MKCQTCGRPHVHGHARAADFPVGIAQRACEEIYFRIVQELPDGGVPGVKQALSEGEFKKVAVERPDHQPVICSHLDLVCEKGDCLRHAFGVPPVEIDAFDLRADREVP